MLYSSDVGENAFHTQRAPLILSKWVRKGLRGQQTQIQNDHILQKTKEKTTLDVFGTTHQEMIAKKTIKSSIMRGWSLS